MKIVGIIPARGGSKGVPGKNIRPLAGRPLILHSVDEARKVSLIDRLLVTTDSREIAEVVGDPALTPFMRPKELAEDDTPDLPVFQHALSWLEANEGYRADIVVHLRPTSPLRTAASIERGVRALLDDEKADAVRGVVEPNQNPYKMWRIGDDGAMTPLLDTDIDEPYNQPRQSLPTVWWQNAAVDVVRADTIREGSMTGRRILPLVMDEIESVDIDTLHDFMVAEAILAERAERPDHFDRS